MAGGSSPMWVPESLVFWVQEHRWAPFLLMTVGAGIGYLVAVATGGSVKVYVFCGAVLGFFSLSFLIFSIGFIATYGTLLILLLIAYNVFLVPDGEPWRLPEIPWSGPNPRHFTAKTPLARQDVHWALRTAFATSTEQIADPRFRFAVESQLERLSQEGFRIIRCHYGNIEEERRYAVTYDFWYKESPVGRPDFPVLPLSRSSAALALHKNFPILKCPSTHGEAKELQDLALQPR